MIPITEILSSEESEEFFEELKESVKNIDWSDSIIMNNHEISYDCSQTIEIEDSQYAGSCRYFEITIKNILTLKYWVILGVISNYPYEYY